MYFCHCNAIALCAKKSETSRYWTITVGRGKKSHIAQHKQDEHFFRSGRPGARPSFAGSGFRSDRTATPAALHRRV
jgi:hypothetical protein